jgi:Na+-translocating ferredoxin:NAD+ oxidoreductase RnfG subunit
MIRDITRAALVVAVMAAGSALLVETRYQLAAVDVAHRQCLGQPAYAMPQQPQPGRLRQFGRATLELADAALGIVR